VASVSLSTLVIQETKAAIYAKGLQVGAALGLPVTSWTAGDPTRSLYHFVAEVLSVVEPVVVLFIESGFLDYAVGDWLSLKAEQDYDVERVAATFATCTVRLSNSKGGQYTFEVGQLVAKNTTTGKLYRNTTGGTLASGPGTTLDLEFEAEEAGSDSSAAVTEIDELVTVYPGVTCSNTTVAVGVDQEADDALRDRCRDKLGSLSPNGPRDAYSYVAKSLELTGTAGVTRVRVYDDSDTGDVTVYLAGPAGAVSTDDLNAATDAIADYATPLCITATVANATEVTVAVTYQLWVYASDSRTTAEIEEAVEDALEALFARQPIGGDQIIPGGSGYLYQSHIAATIRAASSYAFRVSVAAPAGDTLLTAAQVAVLGTVTATITVVADP
jgi:uncharacterized phage protein gp47/JayE